jgi:hypothetical protein
MVLHASVYVCGTSSDGLARQLTSTAGLALLTCRQRNCAGQGDRYKNKLFEACKLVPCDGSYLPLLALSNHCAHVTAGPPMRFSDARARRPAGRRRCLACGTRTVSAGFVGKNIQSKHLHPPSTTFAYLIPQRSEAHDTFLDSLRCATHTPQWL